MTAIRSVCAQCDRPAWHYLHAPDHPSTKKIVGRHAFVVPAAEEELALPTSFITDTSYGHIISDFLLAGVLLAAGFILNSIGK